MNSTAQFLNPSEAARRVGVSAKALRIYEDRGLLKPMRTAAGWRVYGPDEIGRAVEIVELRTLGLSLNQVARVLGGDASVLERALASHEAALQARVRQLQETVRKVQNTRAELGRGSMSVASAVTEVRQAGDRISVAIDLPWPWGGERFELRNLRQLTHVVGPLGSGKTRLAMRLAEAIAGASFVGLDRLADGASAAKSQLAADPRLEAKVRNLMAEIVEDGGVASDALVALLAALEVEGPTVQVVGMLEQGLDTPTQESLIAILRRRAPVSRPIIFLTRSSAILDLDSVGVDEAIIFCPANHSPPTLVAPHRGAPGYEAVATCLATPEVRARTEGVIAIRRTG